MFWTSPPEPSSASSNASNSDPPFITSLFLLLFSSSGSSNSSEQNNPDPRESSVDKSPSHKSTMATATQRNLNNNNHGHHNHHNRQNKGKNHHRPSAHRRRHASNSNSQRGPSASPVSNKRRSLITNRRDEVRSLWGRRWKEVLASFVIITVLSVTAYWNSLDGEFVHDDIVAIVRNPDVRPHSVAGWWTLWRNDYWGMPMASELSHKSYRPLTVLSFRVNYWLAGGLSATVFHLTNVMIHVLVSFLLFCLAFQVLRMSLATSLAASAVFAVHPVHTEAVAGITGRSDALACLLMLTSFLLYSKCVAASRRKCRYVGDREVSQISDSEEEEECTTDSSSASSLKGKDKKPNSFWSHGISPGMMVSGLCGCTAMLAKETGITVMGINILYDLYIHMDVIKRRWVTKSRDQGWSRLRCRLTFSWALICVSLAARFALMNGSLPRFGPQDNPAAYSRSDLTRLLTYLFLPVFNAWLMLFPSRLCYDWQMGSIPLVESLWDVRNVFSAIFYLSCFRLFQLAVNKGLKQDSFLRGDGRKIFVSLLFTVLPFLPAANLFFPVGFVAAERVLYSPSVGTCILIAYGIERLQRSFPKLRKVVFVFLCLMIMSLSVKTWDRNFVWKSRASLFESGVRENPWNAKVHYNYANLQKDLGDIQTAVKHYKIAIKLWPSYASAYNNLGALMEDMSTAEDSFLRAINANPQHNGAHFNLGVIYMRSEKYEEALEHLEECLQIDPSHVEALQYLGACYSALNKTHEADNVFHKLISSDLPPSKLHTNFGVFLEELGLTSKALTHFLLALTSSWDIQALVHAAKLAYELGAEQLFHELSERLLTVKFDPSVGYMLASSYMEKGNLLDAKVLLKKLSEESDSFYKIHYTQLLMRVRRWSEAEWALKEVGEDDPNHPLSLLLLAQIYENLNKTMEALDLLNCAIDNFCPQETNLCSRFYSQLGNLMHTKGAFLSAANYYDMAIKFNPNSVQAHTNIGAIYHLMSNYKQAESHYLAALSIEPDNQVVRNNMEKLERMQKTAAATVATVINQHTSPQNNNHPHYSHSHHHRRPPPRHHHHQRYQEVYKPLHHQNTPHYNKFHFSWR